MKIERMNKGSWGKVRAFFDLTTQEGITIKGFKIIDGINGLFVSMPSQKGNDDEYYDTIWVDSKQLREELTQLAINNYNNNDSGSLEPPPTMATTETTKVEIPSEETVGENLSTESIKTKIIEDSPDTGDTSKAFSDEDIPF